MQVFSAPRLNNYFGVVKLGEGGGLLYIRPNRRGPYVIFSQVSVIKPMNRCHNETLNHPMKLSPTEFFLLKLSQNDLSKRFHCPKLEN